jgi:hypothetical protein
MREQVEAELAELPLSETMASLWCLCKEKNLKITTPEAAAIARWHDKKVDSLISAAPDLLAACQRALKHICNHESGHQRTFLAIADQLELAIGKATGVTR